MMNLLLSEGNRLMSRRMTRFFPLAIAGLTVLGIVIAYIVILSNDSSPDFVEDIAGGQSADNLLGPIAPALLIMAFVIGASYIGADVKTGMLEQLLTWEPRRMRLLAARLVSVVIGIALLAMALAALLIGLLFVLAILTGTTEGTTGELWGNAALAILRSGVAAGLFGAFGLGVTLLVNNSIGSIVGFVIYWFIIENFLVAAFLPRYGAYLPITNANSFSTGTDVERVDGNIFSGDFDLVFSHTYVVAGFVLAGWVALSVVAAGYAFSRRDIDG